MLRYNFKRIFRIKGIADPGPFLMRNGFKRNTAFKIARNEVYELNNDHLEKFCILLCCPPNDLLEWRPEKNIEVPEEHPIRKLLPREEIVDLRNVAKDIPVEKINEFAKKVEEYKKSILQSK
jgi:hypothetical protein